MKDNPSTHRLTSGSGDLFGRTEPCLRPFRFNPNPFGHERPHASPPNLFAARGSRDRRPSVSEDLLARFLLGLQGRGWVSAAVLVSELGTDRRTLREAANRSGGLILGGQRGYCLTLEATVQDVIDVANRLHSQSRAMRQRAAEIEKIRHRGGSDMGAAV